LVTASSVLAETVAQSGCEMHTYLQDARNHCGLGLHSLFVAYCVRSTILLSCSTMWRTEGLSLGAGGLDAGLTALFSKFGLCRIWIGLDEGNAFSPAARVFARAGQAQPARFSRQESEPFRREQKPRRCRRPERASQTDEHLPRAFASAQVPLPIFGAATNL
jgi:hypothetical protein